MRPVAKVGSVRACGAIISTPIVPTVIVNLMPICVLGAWDSQGGMAVVGSFTVFAGMLPVCRLGDINDICRWVKPPHFAVPLVACDFNTFSA
jgi:hypothetical protein